MSTFTLAISCLTTSNLPWFMDLTFQVPMQYCSLQHWTLLLSPVTSTSGVLFLLWLHPFILSGIISPLIIGHLLTWGVPLSVSYHFAFSYCSWGGVTQDGQVVVERSDTMWSTGEGNGKPLQYSCLENSMNSMKRQNDRILKEEFPKASRCPICYWRSVEK